MGGDVKAIFSLYRSCLRQIRSLPTEYLRQFFRLKLTDDVRSIFSSKLERIRITRIKRVRQSLRRLEGANHGYVLPLQNILDMAYGRKGPLKWEIVQPLRTQPGAEPPSPIIPSVESSRPPVWSSEMQALVTTDISRTTKALKTPKLLIPPDIPPERLDPQSPESLTLGPFSKRREVNTRWRFFQTELQKTLFPLQVTLEQRTASGDVVHTTDEASLARMGLRGVGMQGLGVFEELEALSCPPAVRRFENSTTDGHSSAKQSQSPTIQSHLPRRFLRRRFQQLLARVPVLTFKPAQHAPKVPTTTQSDTRPRGRFRVTLSPYAGTRHGPIQSIADDVDLAWLQRAREVEKQKGGIR